MKGYVLVFLMVVIVSTIFAKDLGVWGDVYPIEEEDLRDFISKRLDSLEKNGEMAKMQQTFIKNVTDHTLRPSPVSNLTTTDQPKILFYDPTFVLKHNIEDADGKVLFPIGTKVNPLDRVQLHSVMFFLNSDDKRQLIWAKKNAKNYQYVKYVLVQGNIKEAGNALNNKVYFDQYGKLVHKLGILHIPCIVSQSEKRLKIQEYAVNFTGSESGMKELKNERIKEWMNRYAILKILKISNISKS